MHIWHLILAAGCRGITNTYMYENFDSGRKSAFVEPITAVDRGMFKESSKHVSALRWTKKSAVPDVIEENTVGAGKYIEKTPRQRRQKRKAVRCTKKRAVSQLPRKAARGKEPVGYPERRCAEKAPHMPPDSGQWQTRSRRQGGKARTRFGGKLPAPFQFN